MFGFTMDSKKHYLHLLAYYNHNIRFWEHESLNFGVLCDRDVRHEVTVFVSNKFNKPIILNSVILQENQTGFRIEVATLCDHQLILPFVNEKFALLKIIVSYFGKNDFAHLNSAILAKLDTDNQELIEQMPIYCTFHANLIEVLGKDQSFFVSEQPIEFHIEEQQNSNVDLFINKIELSANPGNDGLYLFENLWVNMSPKSKFRFFPNEPIKLFRFNFQVLANPDPILKNKFTLTVNALETFFSISLVFPYKMILCTLGFSSRVYKNCHQMAPIDLGRLTPSKTHKEITIKIKNNQPLPLDLEHLYFSQDSEYFQIFLRTFVLKAGRVIPENEFLVEQSMISKPIQLGLRLLPSEILVITYEVNFMAIKEFEKQALSQFYSVFLLKIECQLLFHLTQPLVTHHKKS